MLSSSLLSGARGETVTATSTQRCVTGPSAWSKGELGVQAEQLASAWRASGTVTRVRPEHMERGESFELWVPDSQLDPNTEDCVTVAALSMPNLSFLLLFEDEELDSRRRAWPVPSAAGLAEVSRCGARKPLLRALVAKMRSRRGVVEFVIAQSEHPPKPAAEVLRGRSSGPTVPSPQVGRRPAQAPLKTRLVSKHSKHRRAGADHLVESGVPTDEQGQGTLVVHLEKGCHVLEVLAESNPQAPPDIDARLSSLIEGEVITADEEQSGQATLTHCVGRNERFRVEFTGATPRAEVSVLRARYPLPEGIPVTWGPVAGANLARAFFDLSLPRLAQSPSFSSIGVRGTTTVHAELEPDGCAIVALAPMRGEVERLALAVKWGAEVRENQSDNKYGGAAVTLCIENTSRLRIEVQTAGDSLAWILGIWPVTALGSGDL